MLPTDLKTRRKLKATVNKLKDTVLFEEKIKSVVDSLSSVDSSKSVVEIQLK